MRVDPNAPDALAEARRGLLAGARGVKLHPRSDAFGLPHPEVERVVALAGEHRAIVLFHAGRGIPHLGEAVVDLARRHPRASLVLAHAGISDLGWIAAEATRLPNLFFDTAWWQVSDLLQLYATIPPGQILYASDMPYSSGVVTSFLFVRIATAAGLGRDALRSIAGGQLGRIVAGEAPADLGPPPGRDALGPRVVEAERAAVYLSTALQLAYRKQDATEPIALARSACQTPAHRRPRRAARARGPAVLAGPRHGQPPAGRAAGRDPARPGRHGARRHTEFRCANCRCVTLRTEIRRIGH